ncbi:hypothetical protein [Patulibacter defluvii]|uniref:hypothetical protein n=1 Tax=Patulibacter defluvii TaxID=3095358 RepID=UPI002A764A91|nr:hypothetical protein [Patulibacter sp. DM4]
MITWLLVTLGFCVGDHFFHVRNGILSYSWEPMVDGQSVAVWPIFAAGSAIIVAVARLLPTAWLPEKPFRWGPVLLTFALTQLGYALSGQWGNAHPWRLTALLAVAWLVMFAFTPAKKAVLASSILLGVLGPFFEGAFSAAGLFDYAHVDVFHTPLWLAALYINGGFVMVQAARGLRPAPQAAPSGASAPARPATGAV